jgi:acetoacetate decarboxylase
MRWCESAGGVANRRAADVLSDGRPEICQLVAYNLVDITPKGSWIGPARLHLVPHVNAPVADLPVRKVIGAHHLIADLTLPYGRVIYDYNRPD